MVNLGSNHVVAFMVALFKFTNSSRYSKLRVKKYRKPRILNYRPET